MHIKRPIIFHIKPVFVSLVFASVHTEKLQNTLSFIHSLTHLLTRHTAIFTVSCIFILLRLLSARLVWILYPYALVQMCVTTQAINTVIKIYKNILPKVYICNKIKIYIPPCKCMQNRIKIKNKNPIRMESEKSEKKKICPPEQIHSKKGAWETKLHRKKNKLFNHEIGDRVGIDLWLNFESLFEFKLETKQLCNVTI